MYSFIFDQTYINLFILVIIVSIVMFLWRKLIILEGNFFVLEKRVNLIKKDAREDSISRNIEKSDVVMNEIFKDFSPSNACKQPVCFPSTGGNFSGTCGINSCDPLINIKKSNPCNISIDENMVQFISTKSSKPLDILKGDIDVITFANGSNADTLNNAINDNNNNDVDMDMDIDKMVSSMISSSEKYENKVRVENVNVVEHIDKAKISEISEISEATEECDHNDNDTISVSSEITFTSEDKKGDKDKILMKKYSKMPLDKLKEVCSAININSDGTRNQLIARIIDVKK